MRSADSVQNETCFTSAQVLTALKSPSLSLSLSIPNSVSVRVTVPRRLFRTRFEFVWVFRKDISKKSNKAKKEENGHMSDSLL